jgi:hypothetical protein
MPSRDFSKKYRLREIRTCPSCLRYMAARRLVVTKRSETIRGAALPQLVRHVRRGMRVRRGARIGWRRGRSLSEPFSFC